VRGGATCPRLAPGRSRVRATRPRPPLHAQVSAAACGVRGRRGSGTVAIAARRARPLEPVKEEEVGRVSICERDAACLISTG